MFPFMVSLFHSAVVAVEDFDAGVGDYARLLGREPGPIQIDPETGRRSVLFPLANTSLEVRSIAQPDDPTLRGLAGLRLECDDLDRLSDRLEEHGYRLGPNEKCRVEMGDEGKARFWQSTLVDPASSRGLPIELICDETGPRPVWSEQGGLHGTTDSAVDPSACVRALDHVVVFSRDVEATRDFYAGGLGIRLALDRSFGKRGVRLLFFRIGGVTIEIGGRLDAAPVPDASDRFGGLAWQVPDIDAIQARLRADRFDVSEIRDGNKAGTRVCTVRDPVHDVPTLLIEPIS